MARSARSLSALLVGLGAGAVGGSHLGAGARWPGVIAAVAGVALFLAGRQPAAASEEAPVRSPGERPSLSGLGTRVEDILRLAEQQADDHRASARREAERTLSEARSEARLILDRARADAAAAAEPEVDRPSPGQ